MHEDVTPKRAYGRQTEAHCAVCGQSFVTTPSRLRAGRGTLCSIECRNRRMAEPRTGRVERTCSLCGRSFTLTEAQAAEGRGTYCSAACRAKSLSRPLAERLMSRVRKTGSCWIWEGATNNSGYGLLSLDGKTVTTAHRASWSVHQGPIPEGRRVLHNCPGGDNPLCVNPAHLFVGTQKENMADMKAKGRRARTGPPGGQLNPVAVRVIRFMYEHRMKSQQQLAAAYKVSQTTISRVVLRQIWTDVD